jgi:hypothetical protein
MSFDAWVVGFGFSRVLNDLGLVESPWAYNLLAATILIDAYLLWTFFAARRAAFTNEVSPMLPEGGTGPLDRAPWLSMQRSDDGLVRLEPCSVASLRSPALRSWFTHSWGGSDGLAQRISAGGTWSRMTMSVPVMEVRVVRMPVDQAVVPMPMTVRFAGRVAGAVRVLMMLVVPMPVFMVHRLVNVLVLVPLGQMQPEAEAHQTASNEQLQR